MKILSKPIQNVFLASSLAVSATFGAGITQASELAVNLINIDRQVGQLMVALYDNEEDFNEKSRPTKYASVEAVGESVTLTFEDIPNGTYAIMLIHDLNSNGKMDINAMGLPQDGYGFSNNVGMYGVPPFDAASFEVQDYASIDVIVRKPVNL